MKISSNNSMSFWQNAVSLTHLQEVSDVRIGSFGVGTRNLKQGALLTNYNNINNLSDVVAMSRSQNQEIGLWHLVQVDRSSEKVVLKCLEEKTKRVSLQHWQTGNWYRVWISTVLTWSSCPGCREPRKGDVWQYTVSPYLQSGAPGSFPGFWRTQRQHHNVTYM